MFNNIQLHSSNLFQFILHIRTKESNIKDRLVTLDWPLIQSSDSHLIRKFMGSSIFEFAVRGIPPCKVDVHMAYTETR